MSSVYSTQPFSYLAAGAQAPKTGFRKDDPVYGTRSDVVKPIPALRHDQPRFGGDWSIENRLRGADQFPEERHPSSRSMRRGRVDSESAIRSSNLRLPRRDVSLYQSQTDRETKTPSPTDMFDRQDSDVGHGQLDEPAVRMPTGGGGVFDNFILKGAVAPVGVQQPAVTATSGVDEKDVVRPSPRPRLQQLFSDDRRSPVSAADTSSHLARVTTANGDVNVETEGTETATNLRNNSFREINSRPNSFSNADDKLVQLSSTTNSSSSVACYHSSQCRGQCAESSVNCSRCRIFLLVILAVVAALVLFGVGFVAGWFASQNQQQELLPLPVQRNASGVNFTDWSTESVVQSTKIGVVTTTSTSTVPATSTSTSTAFVSSTSSSSLAASTSSVANKVTTVVAVTASNSSTSSSTNSTTTA